MNPTRPPDAAPAPRPPTPVARVTPAPGSDAAAAPAAAADGPQPTASDGSRERDAALVERARGGDLEAFNVLVTLYQDFLFSMALRLLSDRDAAEDAVQDAFLHAYRHLGSFRGGVFRAWLARILLNAATDVLRLRRRRPSQPYPELEDEAWEPPADPAVDPQQIVVGRARERALAAALARLREEQRTAIVLYDVSGFDYHEIARMTGVELGTVKSRIFRGRLALRELLADKMELFRG